MPKVTSREVVCIGTLGACGALGACACAGARGISLQASWAGPAARPSSSRLCWLARASRFSPWAPACCLRNRTADSNSSVHRDTLHTRHDTRTFASPNGRALLPDALQILGEGVDQLLAHHLLRRRRPVAAHASSDHRLMSCAVVCTCACACAAVRVRTCFGWRGGRAWTSSPWWRRA